MLCLAGYGRRLVTLAVALVVPATSACSFVLTSSPPPNHRQLPFFDCNSSYAPPAVDTALTLGGGLLTTAFLGLCGLNDSGSSSSGCEGRVAIAALPLVVLPLASAIYGYSSVGSCKEAKDELMTRLMQQPPPAAYPAWTPPPTPYSPPPGPGGAPAPQQPPIPQPPPAPPPAPGHSP